MKKVALTIDGMHCASCPIMIDGIVEDNFPGVASAQTNYVKQVCIVEFDEERVAVERIIEAIEKIGYKASEKQSDQ